MLKQSLVISLGILLALAGCTSDSSQPIGLVIINAHVIDGSGSSAQMVNVRVVGDRIVSVGAFEASPDDTILDLSLIHI